MVESFNFIPQYCPAPNVTIHDIVATPAKRIVLGDGRKFVVLPCSVYNCLRQRRRCGLIQTLGLTINSIFLKLSPPCLYVKVLHQGN